MIMGTGRCVMSSYSVGEGKRKITLDNGLSLFADVLHPHLPYGM